VAEIQGEITGRKRKEEQRWLHAFGGFGVL
jgi:hypothetical protein